MRDDRRPPGRGRSRSPSAQSHTSGRSAHSRSSHHHRERMPTCTQVRNTRSQSREIEHWIRAIGCPKDHSRSPGIPRRRPPPLQAGFPCAQVLYVEPEAPATEGIVLGIGRKWNCNCCRVEKCRSTHICIHRRQYGHQGWVCPTSLEECNTAQAINDRNQPRRPAQWEGSGWSGGRDYSGEQGDIWS
jgi:hypothetical protein